MKKWEVFGFVLGVLVLFGVWFFVVVVFSFFLCFFSSLIVVLAFYIHNDQDPLVISEF